MGDWPDGTDEERRIEYARELSSWLRVPELLIEEASCLLFGWDPEVFRVTKPYNTQYAPIYPGVNTPHEFAELARRAELHGSLDMKKNSHGEFYITPLNAFEFAQKQGLQMDEPLREVWSEALLESASAARDLVGDALDNPAGSLKISEGKTHEQSEHPSEEWITNKEAAQLFMDSLPNLSDGTARTRITQARKSNKIKGKRKDLGQGYLVEKGSVLHFLKKLKDAPSNKYDPLE